MKRLIASAAVAFAVTAATVPAVSAAPIKVGILSCEVIGGVGFIVGSNRDLDCVFRSAGGGKPEHYSGSISRFGIDLGSVRYTGLAWAVLAPTGSVKSGALAGNYIGASAEATAGVGVGANALIGGFGRSVVLNPISVQAQTGLNLAAGVAGLSLSAR